MTEVLAPAGSFSGLTAAVNAGADAVYLGGEKFGARAYAENFSNESLLSAIDYLHLHKKKAYLTINTLLKEDELSEQLYPYLLPLYEAGLDAVIVQDLGVLSFVRAVFPDLAVHASTQMAVTGPHGAKALEALGVKRIIPARELSLRELQAIRRETSIELETFVHGALCYSYSGQCLFSSMIGGRSGNRGRCAQPCRMTYEVSMNGKRINTGKSSYALSPRDICTLAILPEIIEAGVNSLKIEGRMKKPEYTAAVTAMYRKYTDLYEQNGREGYQVEDSDLQMLTDIYNRGGFTEGYYKTRNGRELMSLSRPNHTGTRAAAVAAVKGRQLLLDTEISLQKGDILEIPCKEGKVSNWTLGMSAKPGETVSVRTEYLPAVKPGEHIFRVRNETLLTEITKHYLENSREVDNKGKKKEKINGTFILSKETSAILEVECDGVTARVQSQAPTVAVTRAITADEAEKQLRKLGNTPFAWHSLQVKVEEGLFYPVALINQLRRDALEQLAKAIVTRSRRVSSESGWRYVQWKNQLKQYKEERTHCQPREARLLTVSVSKEEQLEPVLKDDRIFRVYLETAAGDEDTLKELAGRIHSAGKECYLALPYCFREKKKGEADVLIQTANSFSDGYLMRNLEEYARLRKVTAVPLVADAGMYSFNSAAVRTLQDMGFSQTVLPYELTGKELLQRGVVGEECVVYGYQPLMITAGCLRKTFDRCQNSGEERELLSIKDRTGAQFPVMISCRFCHNIIYNSVPLYLADLIGKRPVIRRYQFTIETTEQTERILAGEIPANYTRGHERRGVE